MAMHLPEEVKYGIMLRHRYEEVGLPCKKRMGSPEPISI
jgi:hypothetical protein